MSQKDTFRLDMQPYVSPGVSTIWWDDIGRLRQFRTRSEEDKNNSRSVPTLSMPGTCSSPRNWPTEIVSTNELWWVFKRKKHTLDVPWLVQCAQLLECVQRPVEFTLREVLDENVPVAQNVLYCGGGKSSEVGVVDDEKTRSPRSELDVARGFQMVSGSAIHVVCFDEGVDTAKNLIFVCRLYFPATEHGGG